MVIYAMLQNALTLSHPSSMGAWYLMRKQALVIIPSTLQTTISSFEYNIEKLHFSLYVTSQKLSKSGSATRPSNQTLTSMDVSPTQVT